jgi:hypothetical protein
MEILMRELSEPERKAAYLGFYDGNHRMPASCPLTAKKAESGRFEISASPEEIRHAYFNGFDLGKDSKPGADNPYLLANMTKGPE